MLRGPPTRVEVPGYTPRVVATPEQIFVVVIDEIERTATGLHRPRRLDAFDWQGRAMWSRPLPAGRGKPCIDGAGVVWVAEPRALLGVDMRGDVVARIDVPVPEGEHIGALVPLPDGFVLAVEAPGGRRGPRGRALRLDAGGKLRWIRELRPEPIVEISVTVATGEQRTHRRPPTTWESLHDEPLLVAGATVLCGFHEWPRTGLGQRYVLDLHSGALAWSSPTGYPDHAAIVGPDTFLIGASDTALVGRVGVVQSWPTRGHYLVTPGRVRVVEMDSASTSQSRTATLLADGRVTHGERLPGFYTGAPIALADDSILLWRAGALLRIDGDGRVAPLLPLGQPEGAAGRLVTDARGRFALAVSDEEYGLGPWPLWIVDTDLPGPAAGAWPCNGRGAHDRPVLSPGAAPD